MSSKNHQQTPSVVSDMVPVFIGSCLTLIYLLFTWQADSCVGGELPPPPPAIPAASTIQQENIPDWKARKEHVPAKYLYSETAPAPAHESKMRSWHNRLLFPTINCPYCGRRVPTKGGSYLFLLIGFAGQIGFSARFLVQWLASEKVKRSVIPESFWWLSIFGSVLLLAYAISIVAWPIILGQAPNIFIYARNIWFIHKEKNSNN